MLGVGEVYKVSSQWGDSYNCEGGVIHVSCFFQWYFYSECVVVDF